MTAASKAPTIATKAVSSITDMTAGGRSGALPSSRLSSTCCAKTPVPLTSSFSPTAKSSESTPVLMAHPMNISGEERPARKSGILRGGAERATRPGAAKLELGATRPRKTRKSSLGCIVERRSPGSRPARVLRSAFRVRRAVASKLRSAISALSRSRAIWRRSSKK